MTEPAPTDDVAARCTCTEPTYGWVDGPPDAERVMCKVCGGQYHPPAPTDDVAALVALRKPGRHLDKYDEGWNDALDIAEQRLAADYEASQGALSDVLTEHREMQERVLAIHKRVLQRGYCQQCAVLYPCPTVDALGGPL